MSIRINSFVGNSHPMQSAFSGYIVDRETLLVLGVNLNLIGEHSCRKEEGKEFHFWSVLHSNSWGEWVFCRWIE